MRTVILTQSTQDKLSQDYWSFSDFIDKVTRDFKHNRHVQAEYYYPGGGLIVTQTNEGMVAEWIPEE